MERRELLGRPDRRAEQHARDAHVLERARERCDHVGIADHRLRAGGLDLGRSGPGRASSPDGVAGGDQLTRERPPATATADDQAARQRRSVAAVAPLLGALAQDPGLDLARP